MKTLFFTFAFALTLFVAGSQTITAQEKRLDSSPRAFQTFFKQFTAAARRNDKTAVAGFTRFPFRYGFDAGDEGTMNKTQFIKRFGEIFGESPRLFMTEKNPLFSRGEGGSYVVSTEDAAHLMFVKSNVGFRFIAYIVEP